MKFKSHFILMINSKNMIGGRYIGEGTYGCIFRPNLPCTGYPPNNRYVSKLIANDDIDTEFSDLHTKFNIPKIDPDSKYFIVPIHNCTIDDITENDLKPSDNMLSKYPGHKGCSDKHVSDSLVKSLKSSVKSEKEDALRSLNTDNTQLIMEYGGKEVYKLRKSDDVDSKPLLETIWKQHLNLIKGIILLNKNEIVHRDIKSENIVVNDDIMRFIDFGLGIKYSGDWTDYDSTSYLYWPADYRTTTTWSKNFLLQIKTADTRIEKISKIITGLFTNHGRHIDGKESVIDIYSIYADKWILDIDHKKNLIKTLTQFMINYRADNKYTDADVQERIKNTFDIFSLGTFLCYEIKALPQNNKPFYDDFKKLVIRMTSLDPFDRPTPIDIFKIFIKMVKTNILPAERHTELNEHITDVRTIIQ